MALTTYQVTAAGSKKAQHNGHTLHAGRLIAMDPSNPVTVNLVRLGYITATITGTGVNVLGSDAPTQNQNAAGGWTLDAGTAPSVTANVLSLPAGSRIRFGPSVVDFLNFQMRFQFATNAQPAVLLRAKDANNWGQVRCDGTNVHLDKDVASSTTNDVVSAVSCALSNGTWYWLVGSTSGTTVTFTVKADTNGAPGSTIATITGALAEFPSGGQMGLNNPGSAAANFGGAVQGAGTMTATVNEDSTALQTFTVQPNFGNKFLHNGVLQAAGAQVQLDPAEDDTTAKLTIKAIA